MAVTSLPKPLALSVGVDRLATEPGSVVDLHKSPDVPVSSIEFCSALPSDWDEFVCGAREATIYHTRAWLGVSSELFRFPAQAVIARRNGVLVGALPLVHQRTRLLANRLVSLPYCNYGGPLTQDSALLSGLYDGARELAERVRASTVEVRDTRERGVIWPCDRGKVSFELELPSALPELLSSLSSKLRAQVRRADRESVEVEKGGADLVPAFYRVFAETMRDLGTPVYPASFFAVIADRLGEACEIIVIRHRGEPVAACLLLFFRDGVEIPWAACTRPAKALSVNMRLYREALTASIERGARRFDFGRCTPNTGTYRFKKQWGAVERPLFWYRWPREEDRSARDPAMEVASRVWQRLPLPVANAIGPFVSPSLKW